MFEGVGNLQQSKGRSILVNFVVLSDIVIFLQENNQKYMFITPENKVWVFFIVNVKTSNNIFPEPFAKPFVKAYLYILTAKHCSSS